MRAAPSLCLLAALAGCNFPDPELRPAPPRRAAFGEPRRQLRLPVDQLTTSGETVAYRDGHLVWIGYGVLSQISGGGLPFFVSSASSEVATDPDLSRKSGLLAWVARDKNADGPSRFVLYMGESPRGDKRLVASTGWDVRHPSFSPDGQRLAWNEDSSPSPRLWVTDLSNARVSFVGDGSAPSWSPDGEWIAFESGTPPSIYKVRPDGSERTRLTEGRDARRATWSPDSRWIAFGQFDERGKPDDIWAVRADGSRYIRVTWDPAPEWDPCWNEHDDIYFTTIRNGAQEIWVVEEENSELLK